MKAGWSAAKLGAVCRKITDGSHNPPRGVDHSDFMMLSSKNVFDDEITLDKPRFLSEADFRAEDRRTEVSENDVLLTVVGTVGRAAVVPAHFPPITLQRSVAVLKPTAEVIIPRFLMFALHSILDDLVDGARGVAQKGIYLKALREVLIPLPPLEEQHRIVAVLDEAFEGLARARAHAEANLQNARELFERQLAAYFEQTHSGWVTKKLNQITTKIGSGATPTGGSGAYKTEGISLIRSLNVHDRWFKVKDLAFIDNVQADKLSNVVVNEGDVLLNITGASIARCCVAPIEFLPARVNQHVSIIRPLHSVLTPEFLAYMLTSQPYKNVLLKTGEDNGSTRQALTKSLIQNVEVSFPNPVAEQEEVVASFNAAEAKSQELAERYRVKLQDIDDLRKSLMQKAFAGELT